MAEMIVALTYLLIGARIWQLVVLPKKYVPEDQQALEWYIEASRQERSGDPALLFTKATFVMFWPAFMLFGFLLAKLQD